MTLTVHLVLLIIALVCFIVAAAGWSPPRISLIATGLAFLTAAFLFP